MKGLDVTFKHETVGHSGGGTIGQKSSNMWSTNGGGTQIGTYLAYMRSNNNILFKMNSTYNEVSAIRRHFVKF